LRLAVATVSVLALGAAACGELPNVTTVMDLRVLGVKCEPAGFLVNLDTPGSAMQDALKATLTALVVDPQGQGSELHVSAVGCPDYIDTITSATLQGSKLCPPATVTSMIPPPIGPLLATTTIVPASAPVSFLPVMGSDVQYEPTVVFGLRPEQVGAFFSSTPTGVPALDESIAFNRDFGLAAIVNLDFELNGQRAVAIKRVVYWPLINEAGMPAPVANRNPTLGDPTNPAAPKLLLYKHRDETNGLPDVLHEQAHPMISISAKDKLYVDPVHDHVAEEYRLRVKNPDTLEIDTRTERELIRFQFYATAGTFDPDLQINQENPITGKRLTDAEYLPPKPEDVPPEGLLVTIWVVAHDERAGTDWASTTITVVP
jgi:hypothetical protein